VIENRESVSTPVKRKGKGKKILKAINAFWGVSSLKRHIRICLESGGVEFLELKGRSSKTASKKRRRKMRESRPTKVEDRKKKTKSARHLFLTTV